MSKTFKPKQTSLCREVVLKLKNFQPRTIPGLQLSHFSTLPEGRTTNMALLVYSKR